MTDLTWKQVQLDLARAQFCIANAQMSVISQDTEMVLDHVDTAMLNLKHATDTLNPPHAPIVDP